MQKCSEMSNAEIHAFITSRLDYCNALLGGCSARLINKLQMVQNAAARAAVFEDALKVQLRPYLQGP